MTFSEVKNSSEVTFFLELTVSLAEFVCYTGNTCVKGAGTDGASTESSYIRGAYTRGTCLKGAYTGDTCASTGDSYTNNTFAENA